MKTFLALVALAAALAVSGCGRKGPDPDDVPVAPATTRARVPGVESQVLKAEPRRLEVRGFGVVVDPQAWSGTVAALSEARAQVAKASAALQASSAEKDRTARLRENGGNISEKDYEAARAAWLSDQAAETAARTAAAIAETTAREQWGGVLSGWLARGGGEFAALSAGTQVLIRVAMPSEALLRAPAAIRLRRPAGSWVPATFVSATPQASPEFQTAGAYYLAASGQGLMPGVTADALLPGKELPPAVDVPGEAALHWQGKVWVYAATQPGSYRRREIPAGDPDGQGGYFVPASALPSGTAVVVRGAEALLSDEFKPATADND